MQPVQRKPQKSLNKKAKIIIILLLIALALIFVFLSKPKEKKPIASEETVFTLLNANKEDISYVSIKPKNGKEYSIEQTSNDEYAISGEQDFLFDKNMVSSIFDTACFWEAHYKIGENFSDEKLSEFGISISSLTVSVNLSKNKKYTFVFGDKINTDNFLQYIYAQHDKTLYATKINYTDVYNFTLKEIHTVPEINFSPDLIDKITIAEKGKKIIITRQEDLWRFESPIKYPMNKTSSEQLAQNIGKMRLAAYEAPANKQNIEKYGFYDTKVNIAFDIAASYVSAPGGEKISIPKHKVELSLGKEIEGVGFYCLYEGDIYKATKLSLGFLLDMHIHDMLLLNPVNISIDRLESLTFVKDNQIAEYSLQFTENVLENNEIEKDKHGNTVYNLSVLKNGIQFGEQTFITKYTELSKMEIDGQLPEGFSNPTGKASASIILKYDRGERIIDFFPFDPLHFAVSIDGTCMHYISKDKLEDLWF